MFSLNLIRRVAPELTTSILDVGGGASTLVDGLLAVGYDRVTVLDLSSATLDQARQRLGSAAVRVDWIVGSGFRLIESTREEHVTPSGVRQAFVYCLCQLEPQASTHAAA